MANLLGNVNPFANFFGRGLDRGRGRVLRRYQLMELLGIELSVTAVGRQEFGVGS